MTTWNDEAHWLAVHEKQMQTLELRARVFATAAHAGQKRKYTNDPYIIHPRAVRDIVRSVPHTGQMLAAAWLHDVVEDTKVTQADIREEFGASVAELVEWLTDVSTLEDGNRAVRKALDRDHLAAAPAEAQTIKVADLLDNTASIVKYDPAFAKVYLAEKYDLLTVLTKADAKLLSRAWLTVLDTAQHQLSKGAAVND